MNLQDLFDIFPEAKTAQETKTVWAYEPETTECGITIFHEDDDGEWYTTIICQGFSYDPDEDEFTCDELDWDGGDWGLRDSFPLDRMDEEYNALMAEHDRTYKAYLEWVSENGQDPCEEFYIQENPREQQQWEITFKRREDKTILTNWKQLTGTVREENTFPPDEVAGYMDFTVKTRTCSDGTVQRYPSTAHPWEKIVHAAKNTRRTDDVWTETRTVRDWTFQVKAELWVKTHNESYSDQLKAAARGALGDSP